MPYKLVKHLVEEMKSDTMMLLRGAGREELKYYGRLRVTMKIGQAIVTSDFEVAEVRRPIFSVGVMEEHGWRTTKTQKVIERDQVRLSLTKKGRLYLLEAEVLKVMRITGALPETQMMPVVVEDHIPSVADAASAEASGNPVSDDVQLPRAARTLLEANPAEETSRADSLATPKLVRRVRESSWPRQRTSSEGGSCSHFRVG